MRCGKEVIRWAHNPKIGGAEPSIAKTRIHTATTTFTIKKTTLYSARARFNFLVISIFLEY